MITATVLLAQLAPVPGDVDANVRTAVELIEAHPDVDLAIFPELFLQGYRLAGIDDFAVPVGGVPLEPPRRAAAERRTAVVVGLAEHLPGRPPANSALCLDATGEIAGVYRKVHLFGSEAEHFARGDRYVVVPLGGLRVGPLICYDVEFPEPARALARAGADLLVTVFANMAPYQPEHDLFSRARAVENRRPHVYANRIGAESGFTFVGGSRVVHPTGEVALALGEVEAVRTVDVRSGAVPQPDYLADLRPGVPAVPVAPRPIGPDVSFASPSSCWCPSSSWSRTPVTCRSRRSSRATSRTGSPAWPRGFPLAIYIFIGWENSAALAEETNDSRRNVPARSSPRSRSCPSATCCSPTRP